MHRKDQREGRHKHQQVYISAEDAAAAAAAVPAWLLELLFDITIGSRGQHGAADPSGGPEIIAGPITGASETSAPETSPKEV